MVKYLSRTSFFVKIMFIFINWTRSNVDKILIALSLLTHLSQLICLTYLMQKPVQRIFAFVYVTTNSNAQNKERQYYIFKKKKDNIWSLGRWEEKLAVIQTMELTKVYDILSRLDRKKNDQLMIPFRCRILREITCFFMINLEVSTPIQEPRLISKRKYSL